jgi:nickel transport protein
MNVRAQFLWCLVAALLLWTAGAALAQSGPAPPIETHAASKTEAPATGDSSATTASALPAGFNQAIEKALDKKLAPIMRMLAEMQEQKVRLTDVLGGLGYIFGLVGVAAYFKRKP